MHPEFKLTLGYAVVTQGSELPIAWFVSPLAAHEWVRANRGNYVPLDVVDCANDRDVARGGSQPTHPKKTMNDTTAGQTPAQRGGSHVATGDSFGGHVRIPMRFGIHGEIVGYCMLDRRAADYLAARVLDHQKSPEVSAVVHMPSRQITEMALCFSPASPNAAGQPRPANGESL